VALTIRPDGPEEEAEPAQRTDFGATCSSWDHAPSVASTTGELKPGASLAHYVVEETLGRGATATVYRARHALLGTEHALKVVRSQDPVLQGRVLREGRIQAALGHPNVVAVRDVLDFGGRAVLVMELVRGGSLAEWIAEDHDGAEVETLFRQTVAGVEAAHERGILHRDLKPENILVDDDQRARVTDFGLGRILEEDSQTRTGATLGTPAYMAPEQFHGSRVDARADLWALGCVLFEMLTRRRAFPQRGSGLLTAIASADVAEHEALNQVPRALASAVRACLSVAPDERPGSCAALLALLDGEEWRGLPMLSMPVPAEAAGVTWRLDVGREELASDADQPRSVGGFRILGKLGEGGMGSVWEAEQEHPRRRVALKTIHPGTVSPRARERFRFEVEALGQLVHPGIPTVHAAGDDGGVLYLVMEKVEGAPLDRWFVDHAPSVSRAILLFLDICDAVHHAHLRGFVHRDLKPANILMTGDGQPRVLDFGIAQAIGERTATAGVAGTPLYMAPEHRRGDDVDVRADVFSLGVVLYELWAGERPVDTHWAMLPDPPAPVPLGERDPRFRGDLEAIVQRALAPHADDRYPSVDALAADLRRFLRHEPVQARPQDLSYRAMRWLQRNARLAAGLSVVMLTLSIGLLAAYGGYVEAERARAAEAGARGRAEQARVAAELATERARAEQRTAEAVTGFLSTLIAQAAPDATVGEEVSIEEALARAADQLERGDLAEEPEVQASVRFELAMLYNALGDGERAVVGLEKVVAEAAEFGPSLLLAQALANLAYLTRFDDLARSRELIDEARATLDAMVDATEVDRVDVLYVEPRIMQLEGDIAGATVLYREFLAVKGLDLEARTSEGAAVVRAHHTHTLPTHPCAIDSCCWAVVIFQT